MAQMRRMAVVARVCLAAIIFYWLGQELSSKDYSVRRKAVTLPAGIARAFLLTIALVSLLVQSGCGQALKRENDQLKVQVRTLEQQNAFLSGQVAILKADNADLKSRLAAAKADAEKVKADIETVTKDLQAKTEELKQLMMKRGLIRRQ